jgi:carbon monoxide dehydrogenase subunit G
VTTVERSRTIPAHLTKVWDVLADFDRLAVWAPNADHTCWLDEPRDDGEMVGRARRVQAGRVVLVETITVWEPPARLAYDLGGLPAVVTSAVNEWRLRVDPSDGDRTVVTLATHVDCGPRPPQQLVARLVARRLAKASDAMLDGLAAHLAATNTSDSKGTPT